MVDFQKYELAVSTKRTTRKFAFWGFVLGWALIGLTYFFTDPEASAFAWGLLYAGSALIVSAVVSTILVFLFIPHSRFIEYVTDGKLWPYRERDEKRPSSETEDA